MHVLVDSITMKARARDKVPFFTVGEELSHISNFNLVTERRVHGEPKGILS